MALIRAGSVGTGSTCEYTYWDDEGAEEEVMGDEFWDDKRRTLISHIYISFDEVIMSIQFGFLENGALVLSKKYGGFEHGSNFRVLRLNQDEYVTGLSGGVLENGRKGIRNLTLRTNREEYFIGRSSKNYPSDSKIDIDPAICDRREFGGFFGSYNYYHLTSIGMYLSPITEPDMVVKSKNSNDQETSCSSVQE